MQEPPTTARETLHALANVLSSAKIWLVVLANTPPAERGATLDELIGKVNKAVGDAEEYCHRLRELVPGGRPPSSG